MISIQAKMIMTALLSVCAVVLYLVFRGVSRKQCMIAMLLSSVGDTFMVNVYGLPAVSTYIGAAFFIAAHLVYGRCFCDKCSQNGYKYKNSGFYIGLAIMLASAAALIAADFTVAAKPMPVMLALILVYVAVIGFNLCSNFAFSFAAGGTYLVLPVAITVFYATDVFIFMDMLNICGDLRQYVWYAYPVAQLMLVLFNSSFEKVKA